MIFNDNTHAFARELQQNLPQLQRFASSFTCLHAGSVPDDVNDTVNVVFDDIHTPERRGDLESLKSLVQNLYDYYQNKERRTEQENMFFDIIIALLPICNNCTNNSYRELPKQFFDDEFWQEPVKNDLKGLKDALANAYVDNKITGTYHHNTGTITLFTKNIGADIKDYLSVFAREYFHAIHFFLLDRHDCTESLNRYYHVVVSESLATAFQIKYLEEVGHNQKANDVRYSVTSHSPVFFPDSGCISILDDDSLCNILERTFTGFEDALRQLVDCNTAEIILKKKNYPFLHLDDSATYQSNDTEEYEPGRDYSTYQFNGVKYNKRDLVYAVLKAYCEYLDCDHQMLYHLAKAFPDEIQGTYGVFQLATDLMVKYPIKVIKERFFKEPLRVIGGQVYVCNQWGTNTTHTGNFDRFLAQARKLGFTID